MIFHAARVRASVADMHVAVITHLNARNKPISADCLAIAKLSTAVEAGRAHASEVSACRIESGAGGQRVTVVAAEQASVIRA